jgi:hypothetical protein
MTLRQRQIFVRAALLGSAAVAVRPVPAGADETIVIVDRASDSAARDRTRALGEAPFITVVHPDEHPAAATVADALATTVGAHIRSLGGLGAYASLAVRGATPGHTAILIDGVPLARIAAVTTDLGRFSLAAFGEVNLYRGAVPLELGGAGIGGALDLVTRLGVGEHGERLAVSLGVGSHGARHVRMRYGDDHGALQSSTTIGYQAAAGGFTYYDDNSTPLNRADDTVQARRNNGFDALDGATRWGTADRSAVAGLRVAYKHQGLPGSIAQPAFTASLATTDVVGDGSFEAQVGPAVARQLGYVLVERQHLDDHDAELGLGRAERDSLTVAAGATSTWRFALGPHRGALGGELRGELFHDRDATRAQPGQEGHRLAAAVMASADLVLDPPDARLVVTPAVRLDLMRTAPTPMTSGPDALVPIARRSDVIASPRLTARYAATSDLTIKGSAGWYARLPTLIEVFGDRGYLLGSPDLRPERGPSLDLGAVWAPAAPTGDVDRIFVEAAGFAHRAHDTIALITSAGFVARAANLGDSQGVGAELVASARYARTLSVTASYTRLATTQLAGDPSTRGKPLPRAPGHMFNARADVTRQPLGHATSLWLEGSWQATSFLDPASLGRVPARWLIAAGARVELVGGLAAALSVANLADTRIVHLPLRPPPTPSLTEAPTALTDVAGFPLPGRSFYLALDWTY